MSEMAPPGREDAKTELGQLGPKPTEFLLFLVFTVVTAFTAVCLAGVILYPFVVPEQARDLYVETYNTLKYGFGGGFGCLVTLLGGKVFRILP